MPSLPHVAVYGAGKVGRELIKVLIRDGIQGGLLLADPNHTMQEVIDLFNQDFTYGLPYNCGQESSDEIYLSMPNGLYQKIKFVQETDRSLLPLGQEGIDIAVDCSGNIENITTCAAQFLSAGALNVVTIVPSNISSSERNAISSDGGLTIYEINESNHSGNKWYIPDAQFISCILPSMLINKSLNNKGYFIDNISLDLQTSNLENSLLTSYKGYGSINGTLTDTSNYIGKLIGLVDYSLYGKVYSTVVKYPIGQGNVSKISIVNDNTLTPSDIASILADSNAIGKDGLSTKSKNTSGWFKVSTCDADNGKYFLNHMINLGEAATIDRRTKNTFYIGYDATNVMVCETKLIIVLIAGL